MAQALISSEIFLTRWWKSEGPTECDPDGYTVRNVTTGETLAGPFEDDRGLSFARKKAMAARRKYIRNSPSEAEN